MRLVTYNIQYGIGLDGRFDLGRIADAVRGADLIALQEVSRNNPSNGGIDMVAGLCDLLPDYFHAYGAPFEVDMGSAVENGRAVTRSFQFGNDIIEAPCLGPIGRRLRIAMHGIANPEYR